MNVAIFTSRKATRFRLAMEQYEDFRNSVKLIYTDDPETYEIMHKEGIDCILHDWRDQTQGGRQERHLAFSTHLLQLLKERKIDYVFCNGKTLLEGEIIDQYRYRLITFHAGLLPWYGGRRPLDRMKENHEFLMGTAAIFLDEGVDTGPIIMESVMPGKTVEEEGFDILLETQLKMIYQIYRLCEKNMIHVDENKKVYIDNADYKAFSIYPKVDLNNLK